MKKLLSEYWNNLIWKYTAKVKKCNIYSSYITLNLCIHPFHTKQLVYLVHSASLPAILSLQNVPCTHGLYKSKTFICNMEKHYEKETWVSFQKIALSQGAFLSILLLTRKANVLKIRWNYNCKSISLENEKNQAYKQEKNPFKLKVITRSLWPKIANI